MDRSQRKFTDLLFESFSQSSKEEEAENLYILISDEFRKHQFKKILKTLKDCQLDNNTKFYTKIILLKIKTIQKIIERKLEKYFSFPNKLKSTQKYFIEFYSSVNEFLSFLKEDEEDDKIVEEKKKDISNVIEYILEIFLQQCYFISLYCVHLNLFTDCIAFLSLGERLIKNTCEFFISPEIHYYSVCIYLFLSSLLIMNENYSSAKNYLNISLKICYKELELRLNDSHINSLINISEINNTAIQESIEKIFFNITIAFYQLGVCNENELNFQAAYQSYKEAKFFINVIPNKENMDFLLFMYNLEKRELLRYNIIEFFKRSENQIREIKPTKKKIPKYLYSEENNIKKYEKLQKYLENLKINEIDDDDPDLLNHVEQKPFSQRIAIPTKTIHVLNYLMSSQFNGVVEKMNKMQINKINNDNKTLIQREILKIKADEREKIKNRFLKKLKSKNINNNNDNKNNLNNSGQNESKTILMESIILNEDKSKNNNNNNINNNIINIDDNNNININNNNVNNNNNNKTTIKKRFIINNNNKNNISSNNKAHISSYYTNLTTSIDSYNKNKFKINNTNQYNNTVSNFYTISNSNNNINKRNLSYYNKKSNDIIPKYNYDKYVFNRKLKSKRDILDHQYQKEIVFQKNLLRSKHDENKNEPIFFDIKKIRDDAEEFYKLRLDDEIQKAKERALKKEEQSKKKTNYINHTNAEDFLKNLKIFPKLVKTAVSLNKRKDSPNTVNKKILEKLDGDIDNIEVIKGYLINAQKRKEKKNKNGNI